MSIVKQAELPNFRFDVNNVSSRALIKRFDQTISISGQSGSNGESGNHGTWGSSGYCGMFSSKGGNGTDGLDGKPGQSSTDSQHALIRLHGTVENLNVELKIFQKFNNLSKPSVGVHWNFADVLSEANCNFQLTESKGVILVEAVGGNGEDGEQGGKGGDGGTGGHGSAGRNGSPGCNYYGGNGGNGGDGENGGSGGDGGDAERKGKEGHGGWGGSYGSGGSGGVGGRGGCAGSGFSPGVKGRDGPYSHSGRSGKSGRNGITGIDGCAASDGSIQYVVVDTDDNILETGSDKYHASVCCYTITDENQDEIYEPDSEFFVTNVTWTNNGAMILPMNRPYIQPVQITSEIHLLNRLFSGSEVSTTLICQYPIQITEILIPSFLGPNERAIVTVNFTNISARSYGACSDSAGSIEFMLSTHSSIKIIPMNEECFYKITPDGRDVTAKKQVYENLFWTIDLLLRDVLIERHTNNIRVIPIFIPNVRTNLLLVTNSQFSRAEFLSYQNLFRLFNYSSQIWDIERYGVLHNQEVNWLNITDLIIFIYSNPQSTFNTIKSQLFLQHMNSSENAGFICIGNCKLNEFDFALFDYNKLQFIKMKQKTKSEARNHLRSAIGFRRAGIEEIVKNANKIRNNFEKQEDHKFLYQFVYDNTINTSPMHLMAFVYENKYVYKSTLDSQVGNRLIMVTSDDPLLVNSHLPSTLKTQLNKKRQNGIDSSRKHKIDKKSELSSIIQSEIDLNSNFGRLLCAILFYQGFEKSHTMISEKHELARCVFIMNSNKFNSDQILASLAMSIIEREYDRETLEFPLSKLLVKKIANVIEKEKNMTNDHGIHDNDWLYLLIQALSDYIDSKFFSSFPWCNSTDKAKQRHQLKKILND
ncbi:unnamed protein product [Rotaria sp. Silwood2]|nr:unnamed protein product [Rotaria sp. Silwood2]CAF4056968.1 unnamed protein product [Rotaria sp. Silwood2]